MWVPFRLLTLPVRSPLPSSLPPLLACSLYPSCFQDKFFSDGLSSGLPPQICRVMPFLPSILPPSIQSFSRPRESGLGVLCFNLFSRSWDRVTRMVQSPALSCEALRLSQTATTVFFCPILEHVQKRRACARAASQSAVACLDFVRGEEPLKAKLNSRFSLPRSLSFPSELKCLSTSIVYNIICHIPASCCRPTRIGVGL